jgi:hypothetical protein
LILGNFHPRVPNVGDLSVGILDKVLIGEVIQSSKRGKPQFMAGVKGELY